jgi:hypothetical protein
MDGVISLAIWDDMARDLVKYFNNHGSPCRLELLENGFIIYFERAL